MAWRDEALRDVAWRDHAFCQRANQFRMVRTCTRKYAYGARPHMLALYDLENDPDEDHNLAENKAYAGEVRRMHARLLEVMTADGDPMAQEIPTDPFT